jgi:translation initiation factor 3 subunit B
MELPNKVDKVLAFAWEPRGHRFCVVHGDGARPAVSFYSMRDEKGRLGVRLVGSLPSKSCNAIFWSPLGKHIVLAGLKNLNGQLEFFSVDDFDTIVTAEHFMCTDIEWDPTGRYVTTSVTSLQQMENGFNVWSFAGRLLYAAPRDRLFQFSWRPRPPTLLPAEKEAEVVRNLKAFSKRYDEEDEALLQQADADVLQERARLLDEWKAWVEASRPYVAERAAYRLKKYGPKEAEPEFTMQKVSVEHTISVAEEPYQTSS